MNKYLLIGLLTIGCGGDFDTRKSDNGDPSFGGAGGGEADNSGGSEDSTHSGGVPMGTGGSEALSGGSSSEESGGSSQASGGDTQAPSVSACGDGNCPHWYNKFSSNNPPQVGQCVSEVYAGEYQEWIFVGSGWDANCGPYSTMTSYCYPRYGNSYERCEE